MLDCVFHRRTYPNPISTAKAQFLIARLHELGYIELRVGVNDGHGGVEDVWYPTNIGREAREVYCHEPPSAAQTEAVKRFNAELEQAKAKAAANQERRDAKKDLVREHARQSAVLSSNFPPVETAVPNWDELNARVKRVEAALEHVRQYLPPFLRIYVDTELDGL
jgi:hypothetical protein